MAGKAEIPNEFGQLFARCEMGDKQSHSLRTVGVRNVDHDPTVTGDYVKTYYATIAESDLSLTGTLDDKALANKIRAYIREMDGANKAGAASAVSPEENCRQIYDWMAQLPMVPKHKPTPDSSVAALP